MIARPISDARKKKPETGDQQHDGQGLAALRQRKGLAEPDGRDGDDRHVERVPP
jgi:hypothetical protein